MESRFLYISLILSIIGLLILVYATIAIDLPKSKIRDVSASHLGKNIRVQGNITDVHIFKGGTISLKLRDETGEVKVYLPYNTATRYSEHIAEGASADLVGVVELYRGDIEVVVENPDSFRLIK